MCFLLSLWNWKTSKEGKDGKVGVGLIILHMSSDNCNNAHVTELRCVIIGNFRFSNRYQSEEHEIASFKVQVMCHRLINCISKFIECLLSIPQLRWCPFSVAQSVAYLLIPVSSIRAPLASMTSQNGRHGSKMAATTSGDESMP